MYSYEWDPETGGIILVNSPLSFSKEPRPVYYKELDVLGFDKYWSYEKDDSRPYMWAEANNYFYRGKIVAKTKGGSALCPPEIIIIDNPEPDGEKLRPVNIQLMIDKNREIMQSLEQDTIKKIYNTFTKYRKKIDVFYVAFSGGKDSLVTLDLVQRTLPHEDFKVLFGDTGMEFPDTYATVQQVKKTCADKGIDFQIARSELSIKDSWHLFGPPATVTRWCCSVHKTAPQILKLRELTNKSNFTGMAFIGVRASESLSRNDYEYLSEGEKHRGQYSCNPILEWNSAELYLYMYINNVPISEVYKKGNRRAGCLVCPRAAERNEYMCRAWYGPEFDKLLGYIKDVYSDTFSSEEKLDNFIKNGGWKARKNGRDLSIVLNYNESMNEGYNYIHIKKPKSSWKEWIKTIGVLISSESPHQIDYKGEILTFEVKESSDELVVSYLSSMMKTHPTFVKMLKSVFRKTACCVACNSCAADCHNGYIKRVDGAIKIDDKCIHCGQCHKVDKSCWVYKSLELPLSGGNRMSTKSLNCYSHHAPKMDWIQQFFEYKNEFPQKHSLGTQMYSFFNRFLKDAGLLDKTGYTEFAKRVESIGLDNYASWALLLVNLSYTPQINWVVKNIPFYEECNREYTKSLLVSSGADEKWVDDVWKSIVRIMELPFNVVGLGTPIKDHPELDKNKTISFQRMPWQNPDPLVILYSLYRFAEESGDYYQFTVTRLIDSSSEGEGITPTQQFGIDRDQLMKILNGLTVNYPDFISVQFNLDLDVISLVSTKTSKEVLDLF